MEASQSGSDNENSENLRFRVPRLSGRYSKRCLRAPSRYLPPMLLGCKHAYGSYMLRWCGWL